MIAVFLAAGAVTLAGIVAASPATRPAKTKPARPETKPAYKEAVDHVMGEYVGTYVRGEEDDGPLKVEAKVIGLKDRTYRVVITSQPIERAKLRFGLILDGKAEKDHVALVTPPGARRAWRGSIRGRRLIARPVAVSPEEEVDLEFTTRRSPTEGQRPPEGAVVLLPYGPHRPTGLDEWTNKSWRALPDGSVEVGKGDQRTVRKPGSMRLHLEFRVPYEPHRRGQGRGNSGVYIHDRYEVQVLDSFGLDSKSNDCGAIYRIAAPKVNACLPPGRWQTYDITFHAAKFDEGGKLTAPPRITVLHNGVVIHADQVIARPTGGARGRKHVRQAPLRLQDHGNKVRYRNIWYVDLDAAAKRGG
jgi:hypothetical protein